MTLHPPTFDARCYIGEQLMRRVTGANKAARATSVASEPRARRLALWAIYDRLILPTASFAGTAALLADPILHDRYPDDCAWLEYVLSAATTLESSGMYHRRAVALAVATANKLDKADPQ